MRRLTVLFFIYLLYATQLYSQEKEAVKSTDTTGSESYRLDEITVTGSAMPIELRRLAASISILKAGDAEMQQIRTADEALNYIPGVYVRREGGLATTGTHTTVTMRGTGAANRTLILKDGIPINNAYTGGISSEWNSMATGSISRIEVVRGPGSAIYGSNSMGGTVNVVTADPQPEPALGAHFRYGSLNNLITGVRAGKKFQNGLGVMASAEYKRGNGYQYMADSLWENYFEDPGNELLNLNAKLTYDLTPRSRLTGIADYHLQNPLTGTATIYDSKDKIGNYLLRYSGDNALFGYNLSAYYNRQDRRTHAFRWDPDSERFSSNYYDSGNILDAYGFIGKINKTFQRHILTVGADIRLTRADSRRFTYGSGDRDFSGDQNFVSFFINDDVSLGESLDLNLGLRYDNWQNVNGNFYDNGTGEEITIDYDRTTSEVLSPRIGLVYRVSQPFRLRASYAMGFKAPNIYYLYNSTPLGSSFRLGNPDLKPERMTYSFDLGGDLYLGDKLEASATYYLSSFRDFMDNVQIDPSEVPDYFDPGGLPVMQYINIGKVDLGGLETSVRYRALPRLTVMANLFYNHSEIIRYESNPDYEGNELNNSPAFLVTGGLEYKHEKILHASVFIRHTDKYYANLENTEDRLVDPATVVDVRLAKSIHKVTLMATVQNVFDTLFFGRYTSPTSYYYAPPRTIDVGLAYEL